MDVRQFEKELKTALHSLNYIKNVELIQIGETTISSSIQIKKEYCLKIRFNNYQNDYTLSFSLLFQNERIWAIDKDNRIGWHIHPLYEIEKHKSTNPKTILEIITIFDSVWNKII